MKYGLIVFKETENIGDDIQSYVAIKYLPKIDYYIEREKLDEFVPKSEEQVITIMNGWYLHSKINFPISPYIYPIYVSVHFSNYDNGGITDEYLNSYSKKKLEQYGPIGCRDTATMNLLNKINVENYFSGCLTTTIEKLPNVPKTDNICIVDIDEKAEKYLMDNYTNPEKIIKRTHTLDKDKNSKLDWAERFKNVEKLLKTYQSAKLVIKSRLHCALPCLAIGTPVLLLYDESKMYTKDRLNDYSKIVTHMSTNEFLKKGIDIINAGISNPKDYLEIRKRVTKIVKKALEDVPKKINKSLPLVEDYQKHYVAPKENIDYLFGISQEKYNKLKRDYIELEYEKEYWKKEFNNLLSKSNYIELEYEKEYWKKEFNNLLSKSNYVEAEKIKKHYSDLLFKFEELSRENVYLTRKIEKRRKKDK